MNGSYRADEGVVINLFLIIIIIFFFVVLEQPLVVNGVVVIVQKLLKQQLASLQWRRVRPLPNVPRPPRLEVRILARRQQRRQRSQRQIHARGWWGCC